MAMVMSAVSGRSVATVPERSRDSRTTARVTIKAKMPIGTLIRKIQFQLQYWTMTPPTMGPRANPETEPADQIPSAQPRSSGGKACEMRESESGMINAALAP